MGERYEVSRWGKGDPDDPEPKWRSWGEYTSEDRALDAFRALVAVGDVASLIWIRE